MPASRSVMSMLLRSWETFLYILKAGPAGGRLRRLSSADRTTGDLRQHRSNLANSCTAVDSLCG